MTKTIFTLSITAAAILYAGDILPALPTTTSVATTTMSFTKGWNQVSSPINGKKISVESLKSIGLKSIFSYSATNGIYDTSALYLEPGVGYWANFTDNAQVSIDSQNSTDASTVTISSIAKSAVADKWNMLGTPIDTSKTELGANSLASIWWYDPSLANYSTSDAIKAGSGFWAKLKATLPVTTTTTGKRQLAIYLLGSDLEGGAGISTGQPGNAGTSDLLELISGYNKLSQAEKDSLDIIVIFGGSKRDGWNGYKVANMQQILEDGADSLFGNGTNYLAKDEKADMGSADTLKMFLNDYVNKDTSKYSRRFLTLWDHGGAYGGYGPDEVTGNVLSVKTLQSVFSSTGSKFDILGFDACLMASSEVINELKPFSNYLLASEDLEPGHGWNWDHVVTNFAQQSDIEQLGKNLVDSFTNNASHQYQSDGKTLSFMKMGQFDSVLTALNDLGSALVSDFSTATTVQGLAQTNGAVRNFGKHKGSAAVSIDLKNFASLTKQNSVSETVKAKADSLGSAIDSFVVYSKEDGTRPNSFGLTIAPLEKIKNVEDERQITLGSGWSALGAKIAAQLANDTQKPAVSDVTAERSLEPRSLVHKLRLFEGISDSNATTGISAKFTDDALESVSAVYGLEDANGTFILLGSIKADQTSSGKYYAPKWNKKWFQVSDSANAHENALLPLYYDSTLTDGSMVYGADVDYNDQTATMEIIYSPITKKFASHKIVPYTVRQDGTVVFSKNAKQIKAGDKVSFWSVSYSTKGDSEESGGYVHFGEVAFKGTASFSVTDDVAPAGYKYQYFLQGEDMKGNTATTPAQTIQ